MAAPAEPYLRLASPDGAPPAPCPPGWLAEPVGLWDGGHREIVYHPRRHDVLVVRGRCPPALEASLPVSGWAEASRSGDARMWVRDRLAATRAALGRLEERPRPIRELGLSR